MYSSPTTQFITRTKSTPLLAMFAAFILMLGVSSSDAFANKAAEGWVKNVGTKVLAVMSSSAADSAKKAKFKNLFVTYADTRRIGTSALGKYAKKIGGKRAAYDRALKDYVVNVYYRNLKGYQGKSIETKRSVDRSRDVIVNSVFKFVNRGDVPIKWRLIKTGGGFKLFDLNVAGIWLGQAQQNSFVSTISKNGGDVGSIITFMKGAK